MVIRIAGKESRSQEEEFSAAFAANNLAERKLDLSRAFGQENTLDTEQEGYKYIHCHDYTLCVVQYVVCKALLPWK